MSREKSGLSFFLIRRLNRSSFSQPNEHQILGQCATTQYENGAEDPALSFRIRVLARA